MEQRAAEALLHEQQIPLLVSATRDTVATVFVGRDDLLAIDSLKENGIKIDTVTCENADEALAEAKISRIPLPLFITSATDPTLAERFFKNPDVQGFFGEHWTPTEIKGHRNQLLHLSGTTQNGLNRLMQHTNSKVWKTLDHQNNLQRIFRQAMRSKKCRKIIMHALWPEGTNIAQVARQYIEKHELDGKTELIIHPSGIEPQTYSEIAAEQKQEWIIPVHIECAVFYGMNDLFLNRSEKWEVAIADTHHMLLDNMQLVKRVGEEFPETPKILSHPSPRFLTDWMSHVWERAPSNSSALENLLGGAGHGAITTASAQRKLWWEVAFEFWSPNMVFTFGTPLSAEELKSYL